MIDETRAQKVWYGGGRATFGADEPPPRPSGRARRKSEEHLGAAAVGGNRMTPGKRLRSQRDHKPSLAETEVGAADSAHISFSKDMMEKQGGPVLAKLMRRMSDLGA